MIVRAMRLGGRLGALEERQFRLLWAGQAVSAFGDGLYPVALAFAVLQLTGSPGDLGLVFMAVLIPRIVLMLGGGVWADRLPRQQVMLAADLLRAAMQALTAVFLLTGGDALWPLLVLSALYGAGDAFFSPAVTGLVPETVQPGRLQQANALISLTRNAFWLAGPAVAGALVATAGPGWAFVGDAATFAVSAAFLARMRLPHRARVAERRSACVRRACVRRACVRRSRRAVATSSLYSRSYIQSSRYVTCSAARPMVRPDWAETPVEERSGGGLDHRGARMVLAHVDGGHARLVAVAPDAGEA